MGAKGTRCNLHKKLDQFSVFAGRNPLKGATGNIMCFYHLILCATITVVSCGMLQYNCLCIEFVQQVKQPLILKGAS